MVILPCRKIQIESTNLCNFNCRICPRHKLQFRPEHMSFKIFKKILSQIRSVKYLDLTGWGEPLLHPQIIKMIKASKKRGLSVSFTTNASLLDQKIAQALLGVGLDEICFSLDSLEKIQSSHHFGQPASKIREFMSLRPRIKTRIQTVMFDDDLERYKKIIDFAQKNHIPKVRLVRLDNRFQKIKNRLNRKKEKVIFDRLKKIACQKRIKLEMAQYSWGNFPLNVLTKTLQKTLFKQICPKLISSCHVNLKGEVTPCCSLPHLIMGDLKKEKLNSIWRGKKFKKFRHNHRAYCKGCAILTV